MFKKICFKKIDIIFRETVLNKYFQNSNCCSVEIFKYITE